VPYSDRLRKRSVYAWPVASFDLSTAAVFLDYDGTISIRDTGVALLEQLATGDWRAIDEEYSRGEIGSRVCLLDEWDLLPKDESRLRATAAAVPLDPGLEPLVAALEAAGATVAVVSDGFGFYVHERLGHLGIPIVTNDVDWASGALVFPNEDRCCACSSCGTCKQAPIKDAKRAGLTTVLVGDGVSDRKAALLVDVIFAKDGLARWCALNGVAFTPFVTLADVHAALFGAPVG
jgi:2-hydroxy-3-keto-5-methylthiopentenyl-1-phosphate phosphatase